jgi:RNA polymerase sigma factor (sigma-70 family)
VLSDAQLARAAQQGDAASLGLLLERHRAPLHAMALQILSHGPQAQDAVQDAFLVAMRKIELLREPEAIGGWLCAILRNVCLMRRREDRGEISFGELPWRVESGHSESSVEEAIERLALREWVRAALYELPEVLRVTAMLRYFGSYSSYEEISAILGVPVGTVKSRLSQAKARLADALLKTAGLEHDEARRLTESRTHYFEAAFEEINQGQGYEIFMDAVSEELTWTFPGGRVFHGHEVMANEFEGDLEAGMIIRLTNVVASKDVSIYEADLLNPSDNPLRCPPATAGVFFLRDGLAHRVHQHFASYPYYPDV